MLIAPRDLELDIGWSLDSIISLQQLQDVRVNIKFAGGEVHSTGTDTSRTHTRSPGRNKQTEAPEDSSQMSIIVNSLMAASAPIAGRQAGSARPCKYERKRLRSAAEFRAVSWQVTKRRLSTTKAAEPAGIRGIKAEKWIQQQQQQHLESVQLSEQTSESPCVRMQLCQDHRGRLTRIEEISITCGFREPS